MSLRAPWTAIVVVLLLFLAPARAEKPNPAFAGRIMLSEKRFQPARTLVAYNAQVTKQSKTAFFEDKNRMWTIYYAAFLKVPLDDIPYLVKLYEFTDRGQLPPPLATISELASQRGLATLNGVLQLDRKNVGANKEFLMIVEYRGKVMSSTKFKLLGDRE